MKHKLTTFKSAHDKRTCTDSCDNYFKLLIMKYGNLDCVTPSWGLHAHCSEARRKTKLEARATPDSLVTTRKKGRKMKMLPTEVKWWQVHIIVVQNATVPLSNPTCKHSSTNRTQCTIPVMICDQVSVGRGQAVGLDQG